VLAAVSRRDPERREDRSGDGGAGGYWERAVIPLGQRDRSAVRAAVEQALCVAAGDRREDREPERAPICWEVLINPEARPASCGLVPVTAANHSKPPAIGSRPVIRVGVKPTRLTSRAAPPADRIIPTELAGRRSPS
jgi:hypothetical protein